MPAVLAQSPAAAPPQIGQVSKDSVWVPTPERLIHRMLQMADTTAADVVVDLGSGDGRIPIHAAREFGARAIGVELEANLNRVAAASAARQGVAGRVRFVEQDLFEADLSEATVVALYISPGVMSKLRPKLLALRPGTRIVSHQFTLDDWKPDEAIRVDNRNAYLWVVPAATQGRWTVRAGDESFVLHVEQVRQELSTRGERAGKPVNVIGARLRGTEISFTSFDRDGNSRHYAGRVEGSRMAGGSEGPSVAPQPWRADRN